MGSGCANDELTQGAKKPRECRRREKTQRKRLLALGVPQATIAKMNTKELRVMLQRPRLTLKKFAKA